MRDRTTVAPQTEDGGRAETVTTGDATRVVYAAPTSATRCVVEAACSDLSDGSFRCSTALTSRHGVTKHRSRRPASEFRRRVGHEGRSCSRRML